MKKNIKEYVIKVLVSLVFIYLMISFFLWEMSLEKWGEGTRGVALCLVAITMILVFSWKDLIDGNKEKNE